MRSPHHLPTRLWASSHHCSRYWERWFAAVTFIPYSLLMDRAEFGACPLCATLFVGYYRWASFFSAFLMVVNDLGLSETSYVFSAYNV